MLVFFPLGLFLLTVVFRRTLKESFLINFTDRGKKFNMSIYTDGNTIVLVAMSKPEFKEKLKDYEEKGYELIPSSYRVAGYVHKWSMNKIEGFVPKEPVQKPLEDTSQDVDGEGNVSADNLEKGISEPEKEDEKKDFLPDWNRVDNFMKDNPDNEKYAKVLLDEYAETFGIKLNRKKTFYNMKADMLKSVESI